MNVVLSVCRKVIVNDQGNLLDINTTSLRGNKQTFNYIQAEHADSFNIVHVNVTCVQVTDSYMKNPLWSTGPTLPKVHTAWPREDCCRIKNIWSLNYITYAAHQH